MYKFLWSHKTIEISISSTRRLQLVVNKLRWEKPKLSIWKLMFFKDIIRLKVFCCLIVWLWEFYAHVKRKNIHGVLMQKHMTLLIFSFGVESLVIITSEWVGQLLARENKYTVGFWNFQRLLAITSFITFASF